MLNRRAYTTDKLPISKANISLSSEEEKLPKVFQKNEIDMKLFFLYGYKKEKK